jgi:hypothetical protein
MNKGILRFLIVTCFLLGAIGPAASFAQEAAEGKTPAAQTEPVKNDNWPSFAAPSAGLYVNGWPAFTVAYPRDWVERNPDNPGGVFQAAALPFQSPAMSISVFSLHAPLEGLTALVVPALQKAGREVKVTAEKPAKLKNGAPAYEAEIEWTHPSGVTLNTLFVATKKDEAWIMVGLTNAMGKVGEELKSIAYSITFKGDKEEPVKVPGDIQSFLKEWSNAVAEHDLDAVMDCYSDRFKQGGRSKQDIRQFYESVIVTIESFDPVVTAIEVQGDKVWLAGFVAANTGRQPLGSLCMAKENGKWKWLGNQK